MRAPSQRDIARKAGVSQATVSMALREHRAISADQKQHVLEVARELGYHLDPVLSRTLRGLKSDKPGGHLRGMLGLVIVSPGSIESDDAPDALISRAVRQRAATARFGVEEILIHYRDKSRPERIKGILEARGCSGMIVIEPQGTLELVSAYHIHLQNMLGAVPTVLVGRHPPSALPEAPTVSPDWAHAAGLAVEKALAAGYDRPGLLIGDMRLYEQFLAGFLSTQHLLLPPSRRVPVLREHSGGAKPEVVETWVAESRIDCLILHGLLPRKVLQGKSVSGLPVIYGDVTGMGDIPAGVRIPWARMGIIAADLLISRILFSGQDLTGVAPVQQTLLRGDWQDGETLLPRTVTMPGTRLEPLNLAKFANAPLNPRQSWLSVLPPPRMPPRINSGGVLFMPTGLQDGQSGFVLLRSAGCAHAAVPQGAGSIKIPIGKTVDTIHFLHSCGYSQPGAVAAKMIFCYSDGQTLTRVIRSLGRVPLYSPEKPSRRQQQAEVQDWWKSYPLLDNDIARPVYLSPGPQDAYPAFLTHFAWKNPRPDHCLRQLRITVPRNSRLTYGLFGITLLQNPP